MKLFVITGINLHEGGALSIYKDCLRTVIDLELNKKFRVVAFVHKKELFLEYQKEIEMIELPKSRTSYLYRFYYEYIYFHKFSKQHEVAVWLSLHDMTPNVKAERIYTYCHNPLPFLKADYTIFRYSKTVYAMSKWYKYIYRINIKKNRAVIVQQNWLKQEFLKMFPIRSILVARPDIREKFDLKPNAYKAKNDSSYCFIYSVYPRPFKNYELLCEAAQILEGRNVKFRIYFTIDGTENKYAKELRERYRDLQSIEWLGILSREELFQYYHLADCMLFPSKLETWGMPITEFQSTGKPVLLADLPYAHETVGDYDKAAFFEVSSAKELAQKMQLCIEQKLEFHKAPVVKSQESAKNWKELLHLLTD